MRALGRGLHGFDGAGRCVVDGKGAGLLAWMVMGGAFLVGRGGGLLVRVQGVAATPHAPFPPKPTCCGKYYVLNHLNDTSRVSTCQLTSFVVAALRRPHPSSPPLGNLHRSCHGARHPSTTPFYALPPRKACVKVPPQTHPPP